MYVGVAYCHSNEVASMTYRKRDNVALNMLQCDNGAASTFLASARSTKELACDLLIALV